MVFHALSIQAQALIGSYVCCSCSRLNAVFLDEGGGYIWQGDSLFIMLNISCFKVLLKCLVGRCDYIWLKGEAASGEGVTTSDIAKRSKDLLCGLDLALVLRHQEVRVDSTPPPLCPRPLV